MEGYLLDGKDLAILNELEKNSRKSATQIAKKLKLSKDGVSYRMKKLLDEKIITRFFIDVDVSKLGLILNKVAFKFQNTTKEKEEEIFSFLKKQSKIGWIVFCSGKWDAVIVAYVKDLYEYDSLVKQINEKYGQYIHTKEFIAHPRYYVCSRKWLNLKEEPKISRIGGPISHEKIDDIDIKIIKTLAENARISILDIAKKINRSASFVISRIKNLEKKKIILNYRIGLNLKKIDKEFCKSFIYLQNVTEQSEQEIVNFCLKHPNVTAVTHSIGAWDLELEMETKNFDEFYTIMNEIKNKFPHSIKSYDAIAITKEYGIDYGSII